MARLTRKRLDNLRRFLSVLTARHTRRFPRTDTRTITTSTSVSSQNETNSFICNKSKRNHPYALMINKIHIIECDAGYNTAQSQPELSLAIYNSYRVLLGIISHRHKGISFPGLLSEPKNEWQDIREQSLVSSSQQASQTPCPLTSMRGSIKQIIASFTQCSSFSMKRATYPQESKNYQVSWKWSLSLFPWG